MTKKKKPGPKRSKPRSSSAIATAERIDRIQRESILHVSRVHSDGSERLLIVTTDPVTGRQQEWCYDANNVDGWVKRITNALFLDSAGDIFCRLLRVPPTYLHSNDS